MNRTDFIKQYGPLVARLGKPIGIFPQTVFAQAFVEGTGKENGQWTFGASPTMKNANNIFNIRPGGNATNEFWSGGTYDNPYVTTESKTFRAYNSLEDSIKDYFAFLVANKRYRNAGVFSAPDFPTQAKALDAAGYGGVADGSYAKLLINTVSGMEDVIAQYAKAGIANVGAVVGKVKEFVKKHPLETGGIVLGLTGIGISIFFGIRNSKQNALQRAKQFSSPGQQ